MNSLYVCSLLFVGRSKWNRSERWTHSRGWPNSPGENMSSLDGEMTIKVALWPVTRLTKPAFSPVMPRLALPCLRHLLCLAYVTCSALPTSLGILCLSLSCLCVDFVLGIASWIIVLNMSIRGWVGARDRHCVHSLLCHSLPCLASPCLSSLCIATPPVLPFPVCLSQRPSLVCAFIVFLFALSLVSL